MASAKQHDIQPSVSSEREIQPVRLDGHASGPGILLIHGLTASPTEVYPLAEFLHERHADYNIVCPLLPGHGTTPADLRATDPRLFERCIEREIADLAIRSSSIAVIGVSMGALLAVHSATQGAPVAAIGLLAPVFRIRNRLMPLTPMLQYVLPYWRKSRRSLANHAGKELFSYDRYPVRSLAYLHRLARRSRGLLPDVTVPTLIALGRYDRYVAGSTLDEAIALLGTRAVYRVDCANSGHVLTHEPDAPELFDQIDDFLTHSFRHVLS